MVMRFPLSDHVYRILCGSDDQSSKGRGMKLICSANNCIHHPQDSPDENFGRLIEPAGYGICSLCLTQIDIFDMVKDGNVRKADCPKCKKELAFTTKQITWTSEVVSKHRRGKHIYYHGECYDAMFMVCNDREETDEELAEFFSS